MSATSSSDVPRVVIIEDDRIIGLTFQAYLQSEGFAVEWYQDGESGIQAVRDAPPDVILLDLLIPTVNGFGAMPILQELGLTARTIVVTALTQREARAHAEEHGAAGYITKPVKLNELADQARAVLAARRDTGPE